MLRPVPPVWPSSVCTDVTTCTVSSLVCPCCHDGDRRVYSYLVPTNIDTRVCMAPVTFSRSHTAVSGVLFCVNGIDLLCKYCEQCIYIRTCRTALHTTECVHCPHTHTHYAVHCMEGMWCRSSVVTSFTIYIYSCCSFSV